MNKTVLTTAGRIDDPEQYFGKQKVEIIERVGNLDGLRILMNRILIAVWKRPESLDLGNNKKIILTEQTRDEDVYQGNVGLVLKMGPLSWVSDAGTDFRGEACALGDWVLYHRNAAGMRMQFNGVDCFMLEGERPIKAVLARPDQVR